MRAVLTLCGLLILVSLMVLPPVRAAPPVSGDWYVEGSETYANTTLTVNGSVYITPGASLVLDNVTMRINSTFDGQQRLQVNASAALVLRSTVVEASDARFYYRFLVYGTLNVTNVTLRHLWGDPYADPFPGGVQVLGGTLAARGLRIELLRSNGIHVVRGHVDAGDVRIDHAPCYGIYLNHTVGPRFFNLTLFVDEFVTPPPEGLEGLMSIDSSWGNFTEFVSRGHFSSEVRLIRSDHFTIRRAALTGSAYLPEVTEIIVLIDSRGLALYDSRINETASAGFAAINSTASLVNVVLNRTGSMSGQFSRLAMENIRFESYIDGVSGTRLGSYNSSWVGQNVTSLDAELSLTLLDHSDGRFRNLTFDGDPFLGGNSTIELVDTRETSPFMFGLVEGSRAHLVNFSYTVPRDGEWAAAVVNQSIVAQKNWLDVRAVDPTGRPISGVEVLVTDDGTPLYASAGFGGGDAPTGPDGQTETFAAPYRAFHKDYATSSIPLTNITYNVTAITLRKTGYGFLPARGALLDADFEDGGRDGWTRYTFTANGGSNTLLGYANVVPGALNGTGSNVLELYAMEKYQTDLLYNRLESAYWRDYTADADARLVAGYPASELKLFFLMRSTDALIDGYRLDLSAANDTVRLYRHDHASLIYNGNPPTLLAEAPYPIDFGFTYHVRVDTFQGRIRVSVNGTFLFEVQDATYTSGTIGLGAATGAPGMGGPFVQAWFDNVRVVGHDGRTFVGDDTPPAIASAVMVPDPVDLGSAGTIRAVVTDDLGVAGAWADITGPSGGMNATMRESQPGLWEAGVPATQEGAYAFTMWAQDVAGLWSSRAGTFSVADLSPPSFTSASVTPSASPPGPFAFSANATDNVAVVGVRANVSGPSAANLTLSPLGGTWAVNAPFSILGTYAVAFWATDAAGHWASAVASFTVGDFTPPTTSLAILGANYTASGIVYLAPSAIVALRATDDLSGVARTEYRFDGASWTPYGGAFSPSPRPHLVEFRSTDNAGNVEAVQSALLWVDATPPSVAVRVDGPAAGAFLGPSAFVNVTAADDGSGVASLEARLDGGAWSTVSGPFPPGPEGPHVLDYRATDRVGNQATDTFAYEVDATSPSVTLRVFGPSVGSVLGPNATLVLSATDAVAGASSLDARLDGGAWFPYAGPLAPGPEGAHTLDFRAADRVGNLAMGSFAYAVDATGPSVSIAVGAPNVTTPASFVAPATPLTLAAADPVGVASLTYRIDGGPWATYAAPFTLAAGGPHVVEYGAVDGLGNPSAIASFATTVDGMPPDVRLLVGSPNATVGGVAYVDAATPLDVDPSDTGAGLASEACTVGGVARACGSPFNLSSLTGSVAIEVRAADRLGNAATRAWTFFVDPPPTAAIDVLTGPSAAPDRPVAFSGARSNDSAGIAAYAWDFGDGSRGTGLVANHSFAAPGEYVVTLAVTNLLGRTSATSVRVVVSQPQLPSELAGWVLPGYIVLATVVLFLAIMLWQRKARPRDQVASPERPEAEDEPEPKDETGDP